MGLVGLPNNNNNNGNEDTEHLLPPASDIHDSDITTSSISNSKSGIIYQTDNSSVNIPLQPIKSPRSGLSKLSSPLSSPNPSISPSSTNIHHHITVMSSNISSATASTTEHNFNSPLIRKKSSNINGHNGIGGTGMIAEDEEGLLIRDDEEDEMKEKYGGSQGKVMMSFCRMVSLNAFWFG
jgi:hypothetical protein